MASQSGFVARIVGASFGDHGFGGLVERVVSGHRLSDSGFFNDQGRGAGRDALDDLRVEDVPDVYRRIRRSRALKLRIRSDERRAIGLRASQIETVVDWVVDGDGDGGGVGNEVRGRPQRDDIRQVGEFREIGLRVGDLAPPGLFPDDVGGLGQDEIGGTKADSMGEQVPGLVRALLFEELLGSDAGVDDQLHRSRSSRTRIALSI